MTLSTLLLLAATKAPARGRRSICAREVLRGATQAIASALLLISMLPAHARDPAVPAAQQGLPQNWERLLDSTNGEGPGRSFGCNSDRFTCVMRDDNGMYRAVRDNETGLVWDRQPSDSTFAWEEARERCIANFTGGRRGWRLPSVHELASLQFHVPIQDAVNIPPEHPFLGVASTVYWSATSSATSPDLAWRSSMGNTTSAAMFKWTRARVWCVRGAANYTVY